MLEGSLSGLFTTSFYTFFYISYNAIKFFSGCMSSQRCPYYNGWRRRRALLPEAGPPSLPLMEGNRFNPTKLKEAWQLK